MAKSLVGAIFTPCAVAGVLVFAVGCSTVPKMVTKTDVADQIRQRMTDTHGNKPESVSCPDDLKATVGATLTCQVEIDAETYAIKVTVTSIEGDNAKFDMVETSPTDKPGR